MVLAKIISVILTYNSTINYTSKYGAVVNINIFDKVSALSR